MISLLFQYRSHHLARRQVQLFIGLNFLFYGFQCSENQNPKFLSNKIDSSNFLKRESRGYHILEELKPGDFERECIEEDCDQEECFEISDDLDIHERMWSAVQECGSIPGAGRDNIRKCTDEKFAANWSMWTLWTSCSETCVPRKGNPPVRKRERRCIPGIVDPNDLCWNDVEELDNQLEHHSVEKCELDPCSVFNIRMGGARLRNLRDLIIPAHWQNIPEFDKNDFKLFWKINDQAVSSYRVSKGVIIYRDLKEYDGRVRVVANMQDNPSSEITISGPITDADRNNTITMELHWDSFSESETKKIADLMGME